jgi:hypothetical protein
MTTPSRVPLDLDAIAARASRSVILFGREVEVRPVTGTVLHRVLAATNLSDPAAQFETMLSVVPAIAPGLTAEERERLTHTQILALIQISQGDVEAVETALAAAAENASGR